MALRRFEDAALVLICPSGSSYCSLKWVAKRSGIDVEAWCLGPEHLTSQLINGRSCDLKGLVFTYARGKYTKPVIPSSIHTAPIILRPLPSDQK